MKITLKNTWTYLEFSETEVIDYPDFEAALRVKTGIKEDGYERSKAYKIGVWDGITPFYDVKEHKLPTGLRDQLYDFIKKYQVKHPNFNMIVNDEREEEYLTVDMIERPVTFLKNGKELPLFDYQEQSVVEAVEHKTGTLFLATNAGKTASSVGIIKTILPYLERNERVFYIVPSTQIFNQAVDTMQEQFGDKVGYMGAGKFKDGQIMVAIMNSLVSRLKDPADSPDVKLTGENRKVQIFVQEVLPKLEHKTNIKFMLKNFIRGYQQQYKMTAARQDIVEYLEDVANSNMGDAKVAMELNKWRAKYEKVLRKKVGDKLDRYQDTLDMVSNTKVLIADEFHHVKAETWYNTIMSFDNAPYKFGMTGSIDKKDKILLQRMEATVYKIINEVRSEEMIERGISSRPTIHIATITEPNVLTYKDQYGRDVEKPLATERDFPKAYEAGIMTNEVRNRQIVNFAIMNANEGRPTLITITRREHGQALLEALLDKGGKAEFMHGELDLEERESILNNMRSGESNIMIASAMVDEGMDIDVFRVLIMAAGGKSRRQTIQRVGRVLRKKKVDNTSTVIDFMDRTNLYLYNQSKERIKTYNDEGFEVKYLNE